MSETDPGYDSEHHAGDVGARRARVGTPTERESINVPPTRPGAAENARRAEAAREEHETFIPESPIRDERSEATESLRTEEESLQRTHGDPDDDEEEGDVRKDIKETRQELGETVSALADKADLKGRASNAAETAKGKATEAAETAKGKAADAAETVKTKAADAAETVKSTAGDAAEEAKKRPVLLIAAAGAVAAFVLRRLVRRRKGK
ncbi:DUF3618 domain-containing protein [Nonomuraea turkmeniaca]|uniref:DUF3618 domain-containing protein n=1 Tax=Nonomuraea turkmeniaca TaxID=103838 RepID=A0A5S4FHI7_9ACTN|nr:DUF3618 domain-containing protein [Nonomuraea turkmeniaca]TMR19184.1 DUF3618 domain-containing protein [Nonomuraea turkmeniaca]